MDTTLYELKTLNRQFQLAAKNKVAFTNNLTSMPDAFYPNIRSHFTSPARKDGSQKWADFVMTFWPVDCVRAASLNALLSATTNGMGTISALKKLNSFTGKPRI